MPSTWQSLMDALSDDAVARLAERSTLDRDQTTRAVETVLPVLLTALARGSSSPDGAEALHRAVLRDHDERLAEEYAQRLPDMDPEDGQAILRHALGANQGEVERRLGERLGLDARSVGQILKLLAPLILSMLAKRMRSGRLDPGGLRREMEHEERQSRDRMPPDLGRTIDDLLRGRR